MDLSGIQLLPVHHAFVNRFVELCRADHRVVACFLGGSNVTGTSDEFSDIDLCIITTDRSHEEFYNQRETFLRRLGELEFLEDFGFPDIACFMFADGIEGELNFGSESQLDLIHSGPFRVLLDKKHILINAVFPEKEPDPFHQTEKLRANIYGFWHELSHFIKAIGRGQFWWARGQLDALRSICVNLARLQNNFSDEGAGNEPYFKIEDAMPVEKLTPLQTTFCPMEKSAMLQSAHIIVQSYMELASFLAQHHEIRYPSGLERVMLQKLEDLSNTR